MSVNIMDQDNINWIVEICTKIEMPTEAIQDIIEIMKNLSIDEIELLQYQYDRLINISTENFAADEMQSMIEKNPLYGQKIIIVYLLAAKHTKELYINKDIPLNIFYNTMNSFAVYEKSYKFKHGVWGFDKPKWALNHLSLKIFRLGRLVFEQGEFPFENYTMLNETLKKGDKVLMVHIPADGKLELDLCHDSYNLAVSLSRKLFGFIPKAFCCNSWLLCSKLNNLLKPQSNILKFQNEYKIIDEIIDNDEPLNWIFGKKYKTLSDYPILTSLQKKVIEFIKNGGELGIGFGVKKI